MIDSIPQTLINFKSKAVESANSVGQAVTDKVKVLSGKDEFIKSQKAQTAIGFTLFAGALVLAGKCIKEIKDKLTETKNK